MTVALPLHTMLLRQRRVAVAVLPLVAVVCGVCAVVVTALIEQTLVASLAISCMLAGVGALLLALEGGTSEERLQFQRLFWMALGFRLLIMAVLHYVLKETYGTSQPYWQHGDDGGDELRFYESAARYARAWHQGRLFELQPRWYEYTMLAWLHIIGFIRYIGQELGGDTVFNIKLFITACGALIVPYTYIIARRLYNQRIAYLAAWMSFWLPDYWYMASSIMRDVLICFLMLYVIAQAISICFVRFQLWRLLLMLLVNFYVIHYLRGQLSTIMVVLVALMVSVSQWRRLQRWMIPLSLGLLVFIAVRSPSFASFGAIVNGDSVQQRSSSYVEKALAEADDDSLGKRVQSLPVVIRGPLSAAQLLLLPIPPWGPFLAKGFTPRGIVEGIAGLVWFFGVVPLLPIGLLETLRGNLTRGVWVWGPVIALALILGASGGILLRWRLMFMPLLLIMIAHGYVAREGYPTLRLLTREGLVGILAAYLTLKYIL